MKRLFLTAAMLVGCAACAPPKVVTAAELVDTSMVDRMLTGMTEPGVKEWLSQHCGPFEYMSRDELQRSHSHVSQDLLRASTGRFRALVKRGDGVLKMKHGGAEGEVSIDIFMSDAGKVHHFQFEVLDDR